MNENERPAIGSSEAAVLTVVELIARAAQMSEQHLAYWLDLYYQVRSRHERDMTPRDISELMVLGRAPQPAQPMDIGPPFQVTYSAEDIARAEDMTGIVNETIEKAAEGVGPGVKGGFVGFEPWAAGSKKNSG